MENLSEIAAETVISQLKSNQTGVGLPRFPGEYRCYRVLLSDEDLPGLVLWFENEKHTEGGSCLLPDLHLSRRQAPRVASFIEGNSRKGFGPADLRTIAGREPVLLAFRTEVRFFYAIDGNNRLQAHHLTHRSIAGIPAHLCVHPAVRRWAYIPRYHKPRLNGLSVERRERTEVPR
jgi:hypothetical protein